MISEINACEQAVVISGVRFGSANKVQALWWHYGGKGTAGNMKTHSLKGFFGKRNGLSCVQNYIRKRFFENIQLCNIHNVY